ncbi:methyltransferase domain-containing protein [Marinobacterium litorale]|uniref:methyltransferase domain-containing protein n=1 Tax=Marinobacterium litorale TaxID=404770 RepID=UPI0003FD4E5C|nr:methyltransferase domain-containing protein [Marinobacterium litorale]
MADQETLKFYENQAASVFQRYESVVSEVQRYFSVSFPAGAKVLDVGAGSGRDLRELLTQGYDAYGVEPSESLRKLAIDHHPHLQSRLFSGQLPQIVLPDQYDGILCSAVFMHLPEMDHVEALINLRDLLRPGGRLLVSIPTQRPDIGSDNRDGDGRLFHSIAPDHLILLGARLGLEYVSRFDNSDSLGRGGIQWASLLFQRSTGLVRTLDRIESVLRNDRKTATYKLALLRAFCDLAEQGDKVVTWGIDRKAYVPIEAIARLWLIYYWPLITSPVFIPQNNSEGRGGKPLAFRKLLTELHRLCSEYYGDTASVFTLFMIDWKRQRLPAQIEAVLGKTLKSIGSTIKVGPIKFSDQGQMFDYDSSTRSVALDGDLWREFALTGYWVRDSLLLRWAELTAQFSRKYHPAVNAGVTLNLLLTRAEPEREQRIAREVFLQKEVINCVWSDRPLTKAQLDVDHALPYALLHNNDLWNLLPAHKAVNNAKRDRVPSPSFLVERRDALISSWQLLAEGEPRTFSNELSEALGGYRSKSWEVDLFAHIKTQAERLIYTRGARPWVYQDA